ncbi:hypothetical protein [Pseudactinotalea sp. Z1748]|uniref:hypothetical protein n=1 Tax=Pseudactinotalea sp. Z1748 TaxID=3413027 RepID=UPI003C7E8311
MYEIDGVVQHIVTASEIRAGDMAKLQCPNRPIDRRDSNPARTLGHLLAGSLGVLAWVAVIYALVWIASVPA